MAKDTISIPVKQPARLVPVEGPMPDPAGALAYPELSRQSVPPPTAYRREAVVVLDDAGLVVEWNAAAEMIFGFRRKEVQGRSVKDFIVPAGESRAHERRFASLLAPGSPFLEHSYATEALHASGDRIPVSVRITATRTKPVNFIVSVRDVSGSEPTELAHRRMEAMIDSAEEAMAVLAVDGRVLSWNRAAESLYGFSEDEVIGQRLASLLVPDERSHESSEWLGRMRAGDIVEGETERLRKGGERVWVSVKIIPLRDIEEVVSGGIWIARDVTASHRLLERERLDEVAAAWRRRISRALDEDRFEFAAQPIVRLADGAIDHHELLLRMRLDDGTIATPNEFLPEAERSGQIREIDLWVVRNGIALAASRPVAINLSGASFGRIDVFEEIEFRLRESGVDPSRITFELTETAAAEDIEHAGELVRRLAELGCGIALDDFGTGFGTFTYLNRLPVTELKIDREFVSQMCRSVSDQRVVETMMAVAKNFGIRTVAEGIEDEVTRSTLQTLGVDLGQGYLFSRPKLIDESWGCADG